MLLEPGKYWLTFSCDHTLVVSMWSKRFGSKCVSATFMFSAFTNLETRKKKADSDSLMKVNQKKTFGCPTNPCLFSSSWRPREPYLRAKLKKVVLAHFGTQNSFTHMKEQSIGKGLRRHQTVTIRFQVNEAYSDNYFFLFKQF